MDEWGQQSCRAWLANPRLPGVTNKVTGGENNSRNGSKRQLQPIRTAAECLAQCDIILDASQPIVYDRDFRLAA